MTDRQHPITPPPELVQHWYNVAKECKPDYEFDIVTQAARWGADQQLEQDAKWLDTNALFSRNLTILPSGDALRKEMRPKPPSLKEQALQAAQRFYANGHENCTDEEVKDDFDTIRRALEALDD